MLLEAWLVVEAIIKVDVETAVPVTLVVLLRVLVVLRRVLVGLRRVLVVLLRVVLNRLVVPAPLVAALLVV